MGELLGSRKARRNEGFADDWFSHDGLSPPASEAEGKSAVPRIFNASGMFGARENGMGELVLENERRVHAIISTQSSILISAFKASFYYLHGWFPKKLMPDIVPATPQSPGTRLNASWAE